MAHFMVIAGVVCFIVAACGIDTGRVNMIGLGLALCGGSTLV